MQKSILVLLLIFGFILPSYASTEDEIAEKIKLLYSENKDHREQGYMLLREIGAEAVPSLIEHLGIGADTFVTNDSWTRHTAYFRIEKTEEYPISLYVARTLSAIGEPAIPALIEAMDSESIDTRKWAIHALAHIEPPPTEIAGRLIDALENEEPSIRPYARWALMMMGNETLPVLIYDMKYGLHPEVRTALDKIRNMGADAIEAVPALIEMLGDADCEFRDSISRAFYTIGNESIPYLVEALGNENDDIRAYAIKSLTDTRLELSYEDVQVVAISLRDPSPQVRINAVRFIKECRDPIYIADFIELFDDPDPGVRREAMFYFPWICRDQAVRKVHAIRLLDDDDPLVRAAAVLVTGKLNLFAGEADQLLMPFFDDEDASVRRDVCDAFANLYTTNEIAIRNIARLLAEDESEFVRNSAATSLGRIGEPAAIAVPELVGALNDSTGFVRRSAAGALKSIGPAAVSAVPDLISLAGDEDPAIVQYAVEILGKIGPGAIDAVPILKEIILNDSPAGDRAILSIGQMEAAEEVPFLIDLLYDPDQFIGSRAAMALGLIGPEPGVVDALIDAYADGGDPLRFHIVHAISDLGPEPEVISLLIDNLQSANFFLRRAAVSSLGRIGPGAEDAVPYLIEMMDDDDLQKSIYSTLRRIGPGARRAVPYLIDALETEGPGPIQGVIGALGGIGMEPGVVTAMVRRLDDENFLIRSSVAYALGNLGPDAGFAVRALIEALDDEEGSVRGSAARALVLIGAAASDALPKLRELVENDPYLDPAKRVFTVRQKALDAIDQIEAALALLPEEE